MHTAITSPSERNAKTGYKSRVLAQLMDTLHVLRRYFEDVDVNEILINAPDVVFISKGGKEFRVDVSLGAGDIKAAITLLASLVDKEVGEKSQRLVLSSRLPGFRVEAMLPPAAINGPNMCIRRHASRVFTLNEYVDSGVITKQRAEILQRLISDKENFLIVGGTGSGKTTFMNTVLGLIPPEDRLYIIETIHELQVSAPNHLLVECDEDGGLTARQAVRTAMRNAPKRIFLGELRGPEAYDWMDGANTGHPGSGATIHANGAQRALRRLENLLLMANMGVPHEAMRVAIGESVQWLFFIEKSGMKRTVSEVCRLHDYDRKSGDYVVEAF